MSIKSISSHVCTLSIAVGFALSLFSGASLASTSVTTKQAEANKGLVQLAYYNHGYNRGYHRGYNNRGYYNRGHYNRGYGYRYHRGYVNCKRVCHVNRYGRNVNCRRQCW